MSAPRSRKKGIDPIGFPCKKAIYDSEADALEAIDHILATRWVKDLSAYRCTICGKWHLTSK
jgi:hypothetical protein